MRACARDAGALAVGFLDQATSQKVWQKDDTTPVTEADLAVNTLLQERLSAARPDYGWLSEETADDRSAGTVSAFGSSTRLMAHGPMRERMIPIGV